MSHKTSVREFFDLIISGSIDEAYARYVHPNFTHHNQYFAWDRQSLLDAMKEAHLSAPNKSFTIHHILEEWDKVMTYAHVEKEMMDIVVVHMCRFDENGMIVEMRDVGQVIETSCPNEYGVF